MLPEKQRIREGWNIEKAITILLHGEGKEPK
jgi:hypothetical protein